MCSHSKKQSILRRLLFAVFTAIAALSNLNAQNYQIKQTVQVLPPYTDKLSDYFASPGKIVSIITTTGISMTDDYLYYLHGYIENTDNAGIWIGTDPGITPHPVYMQKTPGVGFAPYTLTYSELQQIFSEQTLKYQGITREQVQQNGLPAGSYRICFRLFIKTGWMNQFEEASRSCSAPFRIEKKAAIVDQTVQVLPPYTNKLSNYFESPGKIQSVIFVTQYPDNQALFNVRGMLEQVDGNVRIGSGQFKTSVRIDGTPSGNNVSFPPYTLTHTNYREMFREPMVYQGITRDQVQRDGLPEGNYRICFVLSNARTDEEIGLFCSASFRIQKKEAIVNQTVQVLPPYTNKLSDYLESPGKIQSVITVTQYPDNQADLDMTGTLEQVDGNIRIGSGEFKTSVRIDGTPSGNNVIFPPYTLTHANYREMFREPMRYQGITREQVLRDGLPEGTYRLCFQLRKAQSTIVIGSYCSAPFQIRKKNAVVNQAVMVMPPYTNKLSDYFESPGKIRNVITIAQYPDNDASLRVQGTLESIDGKIVIGSAQHAASVQIKGTPSGNQTIFTPYTLTYNELRDIFKEPMNYQGITREQVLRDGLPDGSYRLCFKLYNAQRNQLLSQACSPPFMVTPPMQSALEPPQLIQPYDGSELPPEQKQTVQFTWTMPPGAPATTQYMIKIIEVNDRYANYRDMLRNSSYPAFFETTVRSVPTYLYTPANPAFKEGKTYAWVVRAIGNNVNTPAAIVPSVTFKNDGYSEPAVFTFKKSKEVKVEPPKKETPPIVSEEGLKIFVPECRNCNENFEGLTNNVPEGGSTYYLQGHTLNPNLLSGPNAGADPKGRKPANSDAKTDLGGTSLASGSGTKIEIPADAIAVNNARNFYLRWEDKSSLLAKRQPKPGEGIIYRLQIREAASEHLVWEKDVWERNSYEQTKKGLPFVDGQKYVLYIAAMRGVVTPNGFAAVIDAKGKPDVLASSCQCEFTYMELDDVSDLVEYTVKGKLLYKFEHHPEKYPLTTTTATLTRYTRLIDAKTGKPSPICPKMPTPNDDRHSVPVKINDDGTFEATIYARPDGGLIEKDQEIAGIAGPGARGDLYEFFNLELNSPYYTLGKKEERLSKTEVNLSDKTVDLGEITYNVWSYTLEVEVSKGYKGSDNKVKGTYRELNPPNVNGQVKRVMFGLEGYEDMPYYEGDILPSQPKGPYGKNLITEGKVEIREGSDGKEHTYVTFDRLICNFQYNDHYHVFIEQKLEENGKKKIYYTNEFSRTEKYLDFKYVPTGTEQMQAEKDDHSNFFVKRQAVLLDDRPPRSTVKGRLVFADPCVDESQRKPMANTDIALVVTYLVKDKKGNEVVMNCEEIAESCTNNKSGENSPVWSHHGRPDEGKMGEVLDKLKDRNKILAVTRTDADGNFEFKDFARIDSAFTQEGYKDQAYGSDVTTGMNVEGTLRATVRVVVNNAMKHRWLNPSKDIEIQPNSTMDVGELKAYVDSYILRVKPIGDPTRNDIGMQGLTLRGAWVEIARYKIYDSEAAGRDVVERKRVELKEGVDFSVPRHTTNRNDLIYFDLPNDLHIMTFTSDSTGEHAFKTDKIFYPGEYYKREYELRRVKEQRAAVRCSDTYHRYSGEFHFTSSFKRTVCEVPIAMAPKNPIVSGRLLDSENLGRGVDGTVFLEKMQWNSDGTLLENLHAPIGKQSTSAKNHGYFIFDNLAVQEKVIRLVPPDKNSPEFKARQERKKQIEERMKEMKKDDPEYRALAEELMTLILEDRLKRYEDDRDVNYLLDIDAPGYSLRRAREQKGLKDTADVELNHRSSWFPATGFTLKMGQQMHFPQILMEPNGKITGYVVAEEGLDGTPEQPQKADVRSTRSRLIETKQKDSKEEFTVRVPTLQAKNADTLFILPRDLNYFPDTVPLPGLTDQSNTHDLGKRVVKERRHRIRIKVLKISEEKLNEFRTTIVGDSLAQYGIPGITVRVHEAEIKQVETNGQGVAEFEFTNAGKNFSYELIPPENSEYIASSGELTNHESKEMTTYYFRMRKGATVSGRVTSNGEPVPGAKVWVMNGDNKRQVTADDDGRYTLRGIKAIGDSDNNSSAQKLSSSKNVRKTQNESRLPSGGKYYATIHCGAPDDNEEYANLLGKDTEAAFDAFDGRATVDFDLDIFYKANISTLHGFKVTVTDVQEDGGDNYRITGTIQLDKTPGQFGKKDGISQNPEFKDLKVRVNNSEKDAKGRPYFEVPGEAFSIGLKLMNVELKRDKHTYRVQLVNAGDAYLNIAKDGLTGGLIRSKARIEPESFKFTRANFRFENDQFYLSEAGDGQPNGLVTSFKSYVSEEKMNAWKAEAESEQEYRLHNADRKPLRFEFVTFNATSPINRSRLGTDGVIRLKPDVWLINPLFKPFDRNDTIRIDLPEVAITPGKIEGDVNLDKIDVKFENWTIEAQNCVVDASKGGISSNKAVIRTGTLDLWATTFVLNKDVFKLEGFDPDKIPLGKNKNVSQIDITPGVEFQLVADKRCGSDMSAHLKLSLIGNPAGSIKNLPCFDRPLGFQTISLLSNGESIISFAHDCKALRLYDVVDFHPLTINSYDDGFNLDGTIDFGIPEFPTSVNYKLMFTKQSRGKELELNILPSNLQFVNVGTFKSLMERKDEQIIKKGLVKLHGTIEEEGALAPIRVVVWKKRTPSGNYRIWMDLEDRDKPKQSICLGGGSPGSGDAEFRIEKAGMIVDSQKNKWDFLSLKLVPAEGYGDKSGFGTDPLYFVLSGALRTETDIDREERLIRIKTDDPDKEGDAWRTTTDIDFKKQQIKMAGTDRDPQQEGVPQDGFMDFVLTYDHPNRQLVGDMTITEKNIAGAKFSGALHMVVGRPGFYFMGAGKFSVPVIGNIKGGMIFGYYEQKIPQDVWASILQYSARGEVPCCFTGDSFKGFYAMGAMSIPGVPRIDYEVDLEVASFKFLFEVGAEAAFWGSFQSGRNEIGVSAMVYANLMAAGSIPCCTLGVGAKATIKGYATMLFNRPYTLTLGVCGDLTASGCIKVGNPLSFCKTSLYKGTKSKSAHVNVKASVNLSNPLGSPNLDFKIGWGTCGGSSKVNCPIEVEKEGSPCD